MKMPFHRSDGTQSLNLFSIAALVVVLVLLLIFWAVTPMHRDWGPTRPFSRTAEPVVGSESDLYVYVLESGQLVLGRTLVSEQELPTALQQHYERTPGRQLVLEADRAAPYSKIEVVIRAARDAGFGDIRLLTGPRDPLEALVKRNHEP